MIIRKSIGVYSFAKKFLRTERQPDDWDLAWGDGSDEGVAYRIYVLDQHEWFDPHTSTKYYDGVSHHAMLGPALIVHSHLASRRETVEYHVNDPGVWAWVRRSIAQGILNGETLCHGLNDEKDVFVAKGRY